jgi:ATP/ADP translocase
MVTGRFIFQYLGWATAAFITPMVLLIFGGAFFSFSLSGSPATASWAILAGGVTQVCHAQRVSLPFFAGVWLG